MTKQIVGFRDSRRQQGKRSDLAWNSALREAAFGNLTDAKQVAADSVKLAPTSPGTAAEAALAYAMAGDGARAKPLAEDLKKRYPLDIADAISLAARDTGAIGDQS